MADHEEKQTSPAKRGAGYKRPGQKYKSLLVWQVLLKRSDEEHPLSVDDMSRPFYSFRLGAKIMMDVLTDGAIKEI